MTCINKRKSSLINKIKFDIKGRILYYGILGTKWRYEI